MLGSGVAPNFVVPSAGNEWGSTVPLFLTLLRAECLSFRTSEPLRVCSFPRSQAVHIHGGTNPAKGAGGNDGNTDGDAGGFLEDCHPLVHTGHGIGLPAWCDLDGSSSVDHGSFPSTGLWVTDSTSTPVRLAFGPVLVHRRCRLSALAIPCVETEPPGRHWDNRAGSQWVRGSGVAPVLFVHGVGN